MHGGPSPPPDDVAPDDPARSQRVQAAIEMLVRFMAERAASGPSMGGDDALADNPR